jgi:hypothetical protein
MVPPFLIADLRDEIVVFLFFGVFRIRIIYHVAHALVLGACWTTLVVVRVAPKTKKEEAAGAAVVDCLHACRSKKLATNQNVPPRFPRGLL